MKKMYKYSMLMVVLLGFVVAITCFDSSIYANDASLVTQKDSKEWSLDKQRIEKLVNEQKCEEVWGILWSWAKKGNSEARLGILMDMYMNGRILPGRYGDVMSRMRDAIILAVHSINQYEEDRKDVLDQFYDGYLANEFNIGMSGVRDFLKCVKEDRSQKCVDIAVEQKLVPSFEDFATEMDLFIQNGMKGTCTY